jgi:hypothetical protein
MAFGDLDVDAGPPRLSELRGPSNRYILLFLNSMPISFLSTQSSVSSSSVFILIVLEFSSLFK